MSKVFDYFNERAEMGIYELKPRKMILCDGDCGNCYYERDMNYTDCGESLCKECMFSFVSRQERSEKHQQ